MRAFCQCRSSAAGLRVVEASRASKTILETSGTSPNNTVSAWDTSSSAMAMARSSASSPPAGWSWKVRSTARATYRTVAPAI
ncbi:hypothetical protein [Aureimonas sp. AU40]|uniref:hypothetical protein n=1 Tax=Aureimonas sp. AU40 TaxID=1637747 RepID=UPI0012E3F9AF|nr:hypothetical protein [Aureimonas sp. AU40]